MKYMGGKAKWGKVLARLLEKYRKPNQPYLEPFVGGAHVLRWMSGERWASDIDRT